MFEVLFIQLSSLNKFVNQNILPRFLEKRKFCEFRKEVSNNPGNV